VNGSCKKCFRAPIALDVSNYLSRLCVEVIIGVTFYICSDYFWVYEILGECRAVFSYF
jgi:hypothetical protein